jgi:hypothetical protein
MIMYSALWLMWQNSGTGELHFQYEVAPSESVQFESYVDHTFFWGLPQAVASAGETDLLEETPTFGKILPASYEPLADSLTTMKRGMNLLTYPQVGGGDSL